MNNSINLMPSGAFKHYGQGRGFILSFIISVVLMALFLACVKFYYMDPALAELQGDLRETDSKAAEAKGEVLLAEKAVRETARAWREASAILELEERRRDQARLFTALSERLPLEWAWLSSARHAEGRLHLEGLAVDKPSVERVLQSLGASPILDAKLVGTLGESKMGGMNLSTFTVEATTKFPGVSLIEHGAPELGLPPAAEFKALVEKALPGFTFVGSGADKAGEGRS